MDKAGYLQSTAALRSARTLDDIDGNFRDLAHTARFLLRRGILVERQPHLVAFSPGGLALAREIERSSEIPLTRAAVAEFPPPWPGGPVLGAAAFDGTIVVDEDLKELCSVSREEFHRLVEGAYERVAELVEADRDSGAFPDLNGQTAIVVDDGLSATLATRSAMAAVRNAGAPRVVLVLQMGQRRSVQQLSRLADLTYCASLRSSCGYLSAARAPAHPTSRAARTTSHSSRPRDAR